MDDLINAMLDALHTKVESIVVYGTGNEIAVLTTCKISDDEEARLSNVLQELSKRKKAYSVIDINLESFSRWQDTVPLYRKIKEEGTVIWKRDTPEIISPKSSGI